MIYSAKFAKMRKMRKILSSALALLLVTGCGGVGAVVTRSEFDQVQTGMSIAEVENIIGEPGEKVSETNMAGFSTVMYMWKNPTGSNMNAMFQNGKLISKAQINLP